MHVATVLRLPATVGCFAAAVWAAVGGVCLAGEPRVTLQGPVTVRLEVAIAGRERRVTLDEVQELESTAPLTEAQADAVLSATYLTRLSLRNETITDRHLRNLGKCGLLESLDLCGTRVNGDFLKKLLEMPRLQTLDLSETAVTDAALRHLKCFPSLRTLRLGKTRITDDGIRSLRSLDLIEELDLGVECKGITLAAVAEIGRWTTLQKLDVPINLDADGVAERIAGLVNLEWYGGNDEFSDAGLRHIAQLANLENVDLSGNRFTPAGLKELQKLHRLRKVLFWKADLTDEGLAEIKKIPSLRVLQLIGCSRVTDEGMRHIGGMQQLRTLDVHESVPITDAGVQHLRGLTALQSLSISSHQVTDRAIDTIVELTQLEQLVLNGTQITAHGLRRLKPLYRLRTLAAAPLNGDADFSELYKALKHWDRSIPF